MCNLSAAQSACATCMRSSASCTIRSPGFRSKRRKGDKTCECLIQYSCTSHTRQYHPILDPIFSTPHRGALHDYDNDIEVHDGDECATAHSQYDCSFLDATRTSTVLCIPHTESGVHVYTHSSMICWILSITISKWDTHFKCALVYSNNSAVMRFGNSALMHLGNDALVHLSNCALVHFSNCALVHFDNRVLMQFRICELVQMCSGQLVHRDAGQLLQIYASLSLQQ